MLSKTKIKVASLLSAVAGILVFPRSSAAYSGMPQPEQRGAQSTSQQSAQRSSPQTSRATISRNNISEFVGAVYGKNAQAGFEGWANQNLGAGATNMNLLQLMNYISFRNQQGRLGQ